MASGGSELTVGQLLETRRPGRKSLFAVAEHDSAHTALALMLQHHVSCVAVLREDSEPSVTDAPPALVGMLTLSDFLERVALPKADSGAVTCGQVMTPAESVAYVFADNSLQSCLSIMAEVRCHHLPVLSAEPSEGGVLLGVVAMEELLGLTAEARSQSRGALAETIARLPGLASVPRAEAGKRGGVAPRGEGAGEGAARPGRAPPGRA
ncbi:hypothetical protein FNF29_03116 [Cafeteria roenbergensis]|uniref:CBS domain-containing protein n=1 Tax=Cafeteria roenbergensis TaxID=33653 RepID=A0A5A8CJR4_CAFRO|nr:hypothetical protein FNF29_03116 [Cafeteria roenbergensis]|eukprot:KAA0153302.1 hypothetical protein FNF29_03116 [Cafeteria roenbergensis]